MSKKAEDLIRGYFRDEVSRVSVPPVPWELRRRRFPLSEAVLAVAASLFVVFGGLGRMSPPPLAEKAAYFAQTYEVETTITRGLETARRAVLFVHGKGEKE